MAPAFYAAGTGGWRDWWLVLHPPYTAWHLSYVVIGACLAPVVDTTRLLATLLAFFFAVGIAAHALDELNGRPLHTGLGSRSLVAAASLGLGVALGLGAAGVGETGWVLVPFIVVGPLIVVAYNAELFGGIVHNDVGFAAGLGSVPGAHRLCRPGREIGARPRPRRVRGLLAVGGPTTPQHSGESPAPPERARRGHGVDLER